MFALSFWCYVRDTQRSSWLPTVACFRIDAAPLPRDFRDSMQRSDSYRVHLSVLALAIAACSSGVQAQALDASNAAGQGSPISPAVTPADASGDAGDAETPVAAANVSQPSSEASNQDLR
ncbi:hypothetical protein ABFU60_15320 [Xanthomonas campestris pv. raphani]